MIKARVDASGAMRKLKAAAKKAQALPYTQIGAMLDQSIDINFASGGRYSQDGSVAGGSKTWEPLQDSSRRPLERTGRLRRSISYKVRGNTVELYVDDSIANLYASVQNYGYDAGGIPARPFMTVQPEDDSRIEDILAKHFGM